MENGLDYSSASFQHFTPLFSGKVSAYQLVAELKEERELFRGPKVVAAAEWLETMPGLS